MLPGIILGQALAVDPDEILDDPALEARAREISRELRCITCQSQSIDDSDAPLAKDLRMIVRERLLAGDTDQEIMTYMTDRYGDYVLLKPELRSDTAILWFAPLFAFGGAVFAAFFYFRQIRKNAKIGNMEAEEPYTDNHYTDVRNTDSNYPDNQHKESMCKDNITTKNPAA